MASVFAKQLMTLWPIYKYSHKIVWYANKQVSGTEGMTYWDVGSKRRGE